MNRMIPKYLVALSVVWTAWPAQAAERESWLKTTGYGLMFHYECFTNHDAASFSAANIAA